MPLFANHPERETHGELSLKKTTTKQTKLIYDGRNQDRVHHWGRATRQTSGIQVVFYFFDLGGLRVTLRRRQRHPTPVLLPRKSHGRRSLVGCSPWGRQESDTTERLHFHFSLSCIGEGNGNPLQCSCLENPRDRGAWWAAIYGVAESRPRLK